MRSNIARKDSCCIFGSKLPDVSNELARDSIKRRDSARVIIQGHRALGDEFIRFSL
jgi:hypothetical protein